MVIKVALVIMILLCGLALGQKADEPIYADPNDKISTPSESAAPSMPIYANDSHLAAIPASIINTALAEEDLYVLIAAIRSAGLVELLSSQGPFTIFAPTDKAFANLSKTDLEDILRSNQTLTSVLTYHTVLGNISSADFKNGMKIASEEGGALTFNISPKGFVVNNANITKTDIIASNGIIHVIDTVLGYKALATHPQTSEGWLDKGIALKDMNKYNEALKAIDKAIENDPKLAEAWHEKGLILEVQGRKKEAEAAFAKAGIL